MTEHPTPRELGEPLKIHPFGVQVQLAQHDFLFVEQNGPQLGPLYTIHEDTNTKRIMTYQTPPTSKLTIGSNEGNAIALPPQQGILPHHLSVEPTGRAWQLHLPQNLQTETPHHHVKPLTFHPNDRLPANVWMQNLLPPYARLRFRVAGNPYRIELTRFEESTLLLVGTDATYPLREGRAVTIGRDPANAISIDAPYVSRHHLVLMYLNERLYVKDRGSTNGTAIGLELLSKE